MSKKLDLLIGFFVTVMWGCNFSIIELGLKSLDPFVLTFLRFTFCAIPFVFFMKKPKNVSFLFIILYGIIFGVGLWWLVNFSMYNGLSAGLASVFLQFSAFFTIIFSRFFFNEKINKIHVIGMLVSVVGLLMVISLSQQKSTLNGIFFVILAAISWSICNMIVKKTKPVDMIAFIVWSSLFSAPAILLMTLWVNGVDSIISIPKDITFGSAFSVLFQSYITTIIGYMIWNNLMKKYPSSEVAPLSLFVPISGILSSYIFFNERLTAWQFFAIFLVIFGIFIFLNTQKIKNFLSK